MKRNSHQSDILENNPKVDKRVVGEFQAAKKKLERVGLKIDATDYALARPVEQYSRFHSFHSETLDK